MNEFSSVKTHHTAIICYQKIRSLAERITHPGEGTHVASIATEQLLQLSTDSPHISDQLGVPQGVNEGTNMFSHVMPHHWSPQCLLPVIQLQVCLPKRTRSSCHVPERERERSCYNGPPPDRRGAHRRHSSPSPSGATPPMLRGAGRRGPDALGARRESATEEDETVAAVGAFWYGGPPSRVTEVGIMVVLVVVLVLVLVLVLVVVVVVVVVVVMVVLVVLVLM